LQFFSMGHPLWQKIGSVIYLYNCYWALPALSLSGPSPTGLETVIFRSHLRLSSLFVTSFDSQGYNGGILSRLHTGLLVSQFPLSTHRSHTSNKTAQDFAWYMEKRSSGHVSIRLQYKWGWGTPL
jgi:hypothetical protein